MMMRPALLSRLLAPLVLLVLAALPASAQSCTVTPPATFNFGTINVLPGTAIDVQTNIAISCSGLTAGVPMRLCLSMGDPNGEAGASRYMLNGTNRLYYEFYSDAGRTQRWSSWRTGTGSGREVLFTPSTTTFASSVTLYGRIAAGQQSVRTANPSLVYSENFARAAATLYQKVGLQSGATCPSLTTGAGNWANAMNVTATVLFQCTIGSASLDFGTTTTLASLIDAQTNVSVTCSGTLPYRISLGNGLYGTSATTRKMGSGANRITYSLYRDAARTLNWGSTLGTDTLSGTGTGAAVSVPIYGRVPAQALPVPGTYTDTVTMTITY